MPKHNLKTKKSSTPTQERRFISDGELRIKADGSKFQIVGYAAKFIPAMSENLGGFREELDSHCFDACLASGVDCRALWNHDPNHILGRTKAGTLRLSTDSVGLLYEIDPPDTQLAKDLMLSTRGDVSQSSFGFTCSNDSWREAPDGTIIHTVLKADLFDVSPVTFAAYPDATSGVRASIATCPANLRAKLNRDDDNLDDDNDTDLDCGGVDADDPECADRCSCECDSCVAGDCSSCDDESCDSDDCLDCRIQSTRSANQTLLLYRLRS